MALAGLCDLLYRQGRSISDMTTHARDRRAALYLLAPAKALRLDVREIMREEQRRGRRADRARAVAR